MFRSIATNSSAAQSVSLNRSFTDDGCDQPVATSHQISRNPKDDTLFDSEEPSLSDILGYNDNCTRNICGVKIQKGHSASGRNYIMSSQSSVDSGSCPVSPTLSANNSVSSDSSASQSAWTLETKLARSQERRKRIEGRFQRERSKRRSLEHDREQALKFVKGLLLGLEEQQDTSSSNNRQTLQCTLSSIREFVLQQEKHMSQNDQGSSSHDDDFEDCDDVDTFFTSKQQQEQPKQRESESARKLRMLIELPSPNLNEWNSDYEVEEYEEALRAPSPTEFSDDSSYDTVEAQDEFEELPVKFRSVEELRSCGEEVDYEEEEEDDELQQYKSELQSLQYKLSQQTQAYQEAIDSMKRQFTEESVKREDLLERALTYAEHLEDIGRNKSNEISSKQKDLEQLAHQHFQKIEGLRREHRKELREQEERVCKETAARHAKEIDNLKKLFEEELSNQLKNSSARHAKETKALKKQHEIALDELASIHKNSMQVIRKEEASADSRKLSLKNLENTKLLEALQERDVTIERLRAEGARKNEDLQTVKKTLMAHRSIISSLEKQRKINGKELKKARDIAEAAESSSSHNRVRELEDELRKRDARINDLEDTILENKQLVKAQSDRNTKLQEELQERVFEIATLRNEHSQAMSLLERRLAEEEKKHSRMISSLQQDGNDSVELQRLKKQLQEAEDCHSREMQKALRKKDFVLENLEARYSKEVRKVQLVLEETKEKHAREVASLVISLDDAKESHEMEVKALTTKLNMMRVESLTKPISTSSRSSYSRSRIQEEYDVKASSKPRGKKKPTVTTWFTKAQNGDLDSTSPTVSTSCSYSATDFGDDGSINTYDSRSSNSPGQNDKWTVGADNDKECIMRPVRSLDNMRRTKQAPKNKLPPSLLNIVGGLVKTPP